MISTFILGSILKKQQMEEESKENKSVISNARTQMVLHIANHRRKGKIKTLTKKNQTK